MMIIIQYDYSQLTYVSSLTINPIKLLMYLKATSIVIYHD